MMEGIFADSGWTVNKFLKKKKVQMKVAWLFLLVFGISPSLFAQGSDTLWLWPGQVPGETVEKKLPVRTPDHSGDVIRLTDVTDPMLVVFEPNEELNNGSAVIVCPGGGYQILAIDKEGYEIAGWLTENGFTAFVLQYRVPQKRAEALMDLQRAIRLVRHHSDRWNLDPEKLGVLGFSAGGHLAASASCSEFPVEYSAQDEADNGSARPDFALLIYPAYLDSGSGGTLSPEWESDQCPPPVFLFGTEDDAHVNSTRVFGKAMEEKACQVEWYIHPSGGHGYGLRKGNPAAETWPALAFGFLHRHGFTALSSR